MNEPVGEHPTLPVPVLLAESGNVVNQAQPAHFGANRLQRPAADAVFVRHRLQRFQKLAFRPLELDEHRQEDPLMMPVPRKQNACQFVKVLDPRNPAVIQLDLRAGQRYSPRDSSELLRRLLPEFYTLFGNGHGLGPQVHTERGFDPEYGLVRGRVDFMRISEQSDQ